MPVLVAIVRSYCPGSAATSVNAAPAQLVYTGSDIANPRCPCALFKALLMAIKFLLTLLRTL
eukprot:10965438-Ditylum_brightwellii.AAC.1